ncbi:MAG: tRNA lysidine(34) synthetase TilS [Pseudomonadota bacterium]
MSVIIKKITTALDRIDQNNTIWIAFSGGIDSAVLLHAVTSVAKDTGHTVKAIHIDHQIHKDSKEWSEFCKNQCRILSVFYRSISVELKYVSELGVEGSARIARYQAFEDILESEDILLTAHHADDQVETILLQLFRGAGVQGLTGCAMQRDLGKAQMLRPLLEVSRQQIEEYAKSYELSWLEDPSNKSIQYDRNFLRHEVLPLINMRWHGLRETIARSSQWQTESSYLLDRLAKQDLEFSDVLENPIPIKKLKCLDSTSMKNALRWWMRENKFPMPSAQILNHIISDVINSSQDSEACVRWQHCECRKYRNKLYLLEQLNAHDSNQMYEWNIELPLQIDSLGLTLTQEKLLEHGVKCDQLETLLVKFRQGGETIKPRGRGCHKDLKTLFQEASVEPWLRDRIPLLYRNESLIFVWGYWIQEGY